MFQGEELIGMANKYIKREIQENSEGYPNVLDLALYVDLGVTSKLIRTQFIKKKKKQVKHNFRMSVCQ